MDGDAVALSSFIQTIPPNSRAEVLNLRYSDDNSNVTPLDMAANIGNAEFIKMLLDSGANVNAKDNDNNTALHWASLNGKEAAVRLLLENGADLVENCVGTTAIHDATKNGHLEVFKLLVENFPDQLNKPNKYGNTPLMRACIFGRANIIEHLCKTYPNEAYDIDLNHENNRGFTALDIATGRKHDEVIKLLNDAVSLYGNVAERGRSWGKEKNNKPDHFTEKTDWQEFLKKQPIEKDTREL